MGGGQVGAGYRWRSRQRRARPAEQESAETAAHEWLRHNVAMDSRVHVITLAVADLDRALAFYRDGLGLDSAGIIATEFVGDDERPAGDIALFHLDGSLILALYPRTELAKDAAVPLGPPKSGEFSLGHLVASRQEVDGLLAQARAAGATLTGPPHERPWGIYSGYFRDLDGHLWEVIWNPRA